MNLKQSILKAIYPVTMWFANKTGAARQSLSNNSSMPLSPIYDLPATTINSQPFNLHDLKGKKILLVNTASDCGYTAQYEGLENLYRIYHRQLVVLGFPANDFHRQEEGSDIQIAAFCRQNYGVSFPIFQKSRVLDGVGQNPVFSWLTHRDKNGWNEQAPTWNFCKYLVDEEGKLVQYFGSAVEPMSNELLTAMGIH